MKSNTTIRSYRYLLKLLYLVLVMAGGVLVPFFFFGKTLIPSILLIHY